MNETLPKTISIHYEYFLKNYFYETLSFLLIFAACVFIVFKNQTLVPFFFWTAAIFLLIYQYRKDLFKVKINKPFLILIGLGIFVRIGILLIADDIHVHQDEGWLNRDAITFIDESMRTNQWNIFIPTLRQYPNVWFLVQGSVLKIFGLSPMTIKLTSVLCDIVILLLLYKACTNFFSERTALFALAMYATFPIALHWSAIGLTNINSQICFALFFLFISLTKKSDRYYYLAGFFSGLGLYFYEGSRLIPIILLIVLISQIRSFQSLSKVTLKYAVYTVGFIVPLLPHIIGIIRFDPISNAFFSRAEVFHFWKDSTDMLDLAKSQFLAIFNGFYRKAFNGSGRFYCDLPFFTETAILTLFLIGLVIVILKIRKQPESLLISTFILTIFFGTFLTNTPPASQRLTYVYFTVCIITGIGTNLIYTFTEKIIKKPRLSPYLHQFIFIILLLIIPIFNLNSYFIKNIPQYETEHSPEYKLAQYFKDNNLPIYPILFYAPKHREWLTDLHLHDKTKTINANVSTVENNFKQGEQFYIVVDNHYLSPNIKDYINNGLFRRVEKKEITVPEQNDFKLYFVTLTI